MIVGFVIVILIPGIYLYVKYSSESRDSVTNAKVDAITNEIIKATEQVYSYGDGSQTSVNIDFPENVIMVNFQDKEIIFTVLNSKGSENEITKVSSVDLIGDITIIPGTKKITIKSLGNAVSVFVECSQGTNRCGYEAECDYYNEEYQENQGCVMTCNNNKWESNMLCDIGCADNECIPMEGFEGG